MFIAVGICCPLIFIGVVGFLGVYFSFSYATLQNVTLLLHL